jgi:hypothetical protein
MRCNASSTGSRATNSRVSSGKRAGDVLAAVVGVARDWKDNQRGEPPTTRRIPGGAVTLTMPIADDVRSVRAQLVVRWEPDGQIFAAIIGKPSDSEQS